MENKIKKNNSFPGPTQKDKKIETGLMAIGSNSRLVVVRKRGWQIIGPWKLLLRVPPNQIKRLPQPLNSYVCTAQSSFKMSLGSLRVQEGWQDVTPLQEGGPHSKRVNGSLILTFLTFSMLSIFV
jgi:hypothetical protein